MAKAIHRGNATTAAMEATDPARVKKRRQTKKSKLTAEQRNEIRDVGRELSSLLRDLRRGRMAAKDVRERMGRPTLVGLDPRRVREVVGDDLVRACHEEIMEPRGRAVPVSLAEVTKMLEEGIGTTHAALVQLAELLGAAIPPMEEARPGDGIVGAIERQARQLPGLRAIVEACLGRVRG